MKLIALFIAIGISISYAGNSYSQVTTLSLKLENRSVREVFTEIEKHSEYIFLYNKNTLDPSRIVSLIVENGTINEILDKLFKGTDNIYKVSDRQVYISKALEQETFTEKNQQQKRQISGKVKDENGDPIIGGNVIENGTSNGTVTNIDGNFTLEINENSSLQISYVGYLSVNITTSGKNRIEVTLQEDTKGLEDVVVIGYGTVRKSDLTGSVASISSSDLTAYPSLSVAQSMQGRTAGLQISSTNGEPGSSYVIRIRGASSINAGSDPIFVVDGFIGGSVPPAEDIESIEILKDASATAIYGSRGANGVIIVTTKRGKTGETRINFNASYSVQKEIKRLELLNAKQFGSYVHEALPNYIMDSEDTDWQDIVLQQGEIQNYQLSLSGGAEKVRYYLSGIYYDQTGIVINSTYNRLSLQSNLDIEPVKGVKFGANLFMNRNKQSGVRTQEDSGGTGPGAIASAYRFAPDLGIYRADGTFTRNKIGEPGDNPYVAATERTDERLSNRMQANLYGELELLKELKFRTTLGLGASDSRNGTYVPTTMAGGDNAGGSASFSTGKSTSLLNENYLTFSKDFNDFHRLTTVIGYSHQKSHSESMGAEAENFISDSFLYWNMGSSTVWRAPSSGMSESVLASWYGRINYSLLDRYLFTINARRDGSSSFSKNHKWAFFPSGAFAWILNNESFLQDINWLSQLKIRVSYGKTGNQAIGAYQTLARLSTDPAVIGGNVQTGIRPTTVANNELTWETTAQTDFGADIGFFANRITLTTDYYIKKTNDLLFSVPLPQYSGYSSQLSNVGAVENKGFEFGISSKNFVREFKWNMDFNISFNRNKITALPEGKDIYYESFPGHMVGTGTTQVLRVGQPVGSFFGFIYDGVYQEGDTFLPGGGFEQIAGGEKYRDINGTKDANGNLVGEPDDRLNNDDRTIIGNPHPDYIFGWTNNFSWKGFDLSLFVQSVQGNDIYSFTLMELERLSGASNSTTRALNRWTPTNTNTDIPKVNPGRAYKSSTRWIYDGSYIRLKNISLGYTLSKSQLKGLGARSLRLYMSAQNMLTVTKYPGTDPEVNYRSYSSSSRNTNIGLDYGSFPNAKSVTFGVNLEF